MRLISGFRAVFVRPGHPARQTGASGRLPGFRLPLLPRFAETANVPQDSRRRDPFTRVRPNTVRLMAART